jgi:hypothetical protein
MPNTDEVFYADLRRPFIHGRSDLCKSSGMRGNQAAKNMPKILATTE